MGFAQYDSEKVLKVLEAVENTERKMYYEGLGIDVSNATSLDSALKLSGLDYMVEKYPAAAMIPSEQEIMGRKVVVTAPQLVPDQFITMRTDTMQSFGAVGKNYQICQNNEAFDFLDSLVVGGNAKFESAGSYGTNNAKSFICMSTEPMKILGDEFKPYMNFLNSFDGSGSVQVFFSPVRLFCSNCIVRALKSAVNKVCIKHSSSLQSRLESAKEVLLENTNYLTKLKEEAEKLATTPFSAEAFEVLARELFPVKEEDSEIVQIRNLAQVEQLLKAYKQDDLQNFNGTAWKAIQAVSDFDSHPIAFRNSKTPAAFTSVMADMSLLNKVWDRVVA